MHHVHRILCKSFADVFGYDVLKRPSIVVTTPASPTTPGARKAAPPPTFFPPPVAPLRPPKMPTTKAPVPPQPRVTAPPLLTETVRKSFNFNLNWNRNVPQTTVAMPTVKAPPAVPLVPTVPSSVGKNNAVPLTQQYLYNDIEPHRFNNLNNNDYEQREEPKSLLVAQILTPSTIDPYNNYQQSKDKLRESITEFWNHSPYYRDQKGYKFLTTPETTNDVSSLAPERSKYEDYDLVGVDYLDDKRELIKDDLINDDGTIENIEKYKTAESKENPSLDHQKNNSTTTTTTKIETVIVSKTNCNRKSKKTTKKKLNLNDAIRNSAYKNVDKQSSASAVILPQYSGILPVGIDHLTIGEKNHTPWPIPFDTEVSATKIRKYDVDARRRRRMDDSGVAERSDDYNWNRYGRDVYNSRFDGVASEPNYEKYERPDDDEVVKKGQVLLRSFGAKINVFKRKLPV